MTIANTQESPMHIPKGMKVAVAGAAPTAFINPKDVHRSPRPEPRRNGPIGGSVFHTDSTPSTDRGRKEVKDDLLRSAYGYEVKDDIQADRRTNVQIEGQYDSYRDRIIDLLTQFEGIWDGHLGLIRSVEHRIELLPGSSPIFQHPRRAGPEQRAHEKKEI